MGIFPLDALTMTCIHISVIIGRHSLSDFEFTFFWNCLAFKLYKTLTDSSACTNFLYHNGEWCCWEDKIIKPTLNSYRFILFECVHLHWLRHLFCANVAIAKQNRINKAVELKKNNFSESVCIRFGSVVCQSILMYILWLTCPFDEIRIWMRSVIWAVIVLKLDYFSCCTKCLQKILLNACWLYSLCEILPQVFVKIVMSWVTCTIGEKMNR